MYECDYCGSTSFNQNVIPEEEQYNNGYDWAAGALLRGEETLQSIKVCTAGGNISPFNRGAKNACKKLIELGKTEFFPKSSDAVRKFNEIQSTVLAGETTELNVRRYGQTNSSARGGAAKG